MFLSLRATTHVWRSATNEHRLAEPGHAFEERVPSREQADDDPVDDLRVADDDLPDLLAEGLDLRPEFLDFRSHAFRCFAHGLLLDR